jgi:lipoprotein-anchoring transpeptidase ErfK/SrfK
VTYPSRERPGTIIVDPGAHFLYLVQGGGQAIRYGVGVGSEGFGWSGMSTVHSKQEWPDWYPPWLRDARRRRKPYWRSRSLPLARQQGHTVPNPRTNEPWTIGQNVSAGCIRLTNDDVTDLYDHVPIGTKVVVLPTATTTAPTQ